jgi:hypothetical protein
VRLFERLLVKPGGLTEKKITPTALANVQASIGEAWWVNRLENYADGVG